MAYGVPFPPHWTVGGPEVLPSFPVKIEKNQKRKNTIGPILKVTWNKQTFCPEQTQSFLILIVLL